MSADNWTDCPKCGKKLGFREDYELGMLDGVFFVDYRGNCSTYRSDGCEYSYNYKVNINLLTPLSKETK